MRISRLVETVKQMQRASRNFGFQVQHGTIRRRKGIRKLLRLAYSTLSLDICIYRVFRTLSAFPQIYESSFLIPIQNYFFLNVSTCIDVIIFGLQKKTKRKIKDLRSKDKWRGKKDVRRSPPFDKIIIYD